jgi:phosphatidate cytidylyltransferase
MDNRHDGDDDNDLQEQPGGRPDATVPPPRHFPSSHVGRPEIEGVEAGVAAGFGATSKVVSGTSPSADTAARPSVARPVTLSDDGGAFAGDSELPDEILQGVELPDWTDPPTMEVPRVLRRPGDSGSRSMPGPVWRESNRDFDQDRAAFAEMVSGSVPIVAHDESGQGDEDFPIGDGSATHDDLGDDNSDRVQVSTPTPEAGRVRFAGRLVAIGRTDKPVAAASLESEPGEPPTAGGRNMIVATATGLAVGGVALLCSLIGPPAMLALACVVILLGAAEAFQALRRARYRPATLLGLVAAPLFAIVAYLKGTEAVALSMALAALATLIWYLVSGLTKNIVRNASATLFTIVWIAGLGSFAGLLLDPSAFPLRHGVAYLLGAIEATVAYDVGGLVAGRLAGRHKLAPRVSPNKTFEGLIGGSVAALVVALAVTSQMSPWTLSHAAALGVIVAVMAPLGDLGESLVKRDLRVKDMGTLLPAHGGVLDRIDALLFVLPVTYLLVRSFHG